MSTGKKENVGLAWWMLLAVGGKGREGSGKEGKGGNWGMTRKLKGEEGETDASAGLKWTQERRDRSRENATSI